MYIYQKVLIYLTSYKSCGNISFPPEVNAMQLIN